MERDPLRALGPDPRKARELVDQILDRSSEHFWLHPGEAEPSHATCDRPERLLLQIASLAERVVDGGRDGVAEHLDVVRIRFALEEGGIDRDRHDLLVARRDDLHRAAARGALDLFLGDLGLSFLHLGRHLLGLFHHALHVLQRSLPPTSSTTSAARPLRINSTGSSAFASSASVSATSSMVSSGSGAGVAASAPRAANATEHFTPSAEWMPSTSIDRFLSWAIVSRWNSL